MTHPLTWPHSLLVCPKFSPSPPRSRPRPVGRHPRPAGRHPRPSLSAALCGLQALLSASLPPPVCPLQIVALPPLAFAIAVPPSAPSAYALCRLCNPPVRPLQDLVDLPLPLVCASALAAPLATRGSPLDHGVTHRHCKSAILQLQKLSPKVWVIYFVNGSNYSTKVWFIIVYKIIYGHKWPKWPSPQSPTWVIKILKSYSDYKSTMHILSG